MTTQKKMIGVNIGVKEKLDKIKVHPRETYGQVIERLIKNETD